MTTKQRVISICEKNNIEIDIAKGFGINIDLIAPDGFIFQGSGTWLICSPTYYTCKYEVWEYLLECLESQLPLEKNNCEENNELPNP